MADSLSSGCGSTYVTSLVPGTSGVASASISHTRNMSINTSLGGTSIVLHSENRTFNLQANGGLSVSEDCTLIDTYFLTLDLDINSGVYRKETKRLTFSAADSRTIGYITTLTGGVNVLNARSAVLFAPLLESTYELHVVINGNDTLLETKTGSQSLYSGNFLLVYPGYYLDGLLVGSLTPEEQAQWDGINYGADAKANMSFDWPHVEEQNYYFKATPVMLPGDKESLDGSFKFLGDYFYPKWIKKVSFRQDWFAQAAAKRVLLDPSLKVNDLGTIIPTADADLSYSTTVELSPDWMDTAGSLAQIMTAPKYNTAVFSIYDKVMDIVVNGRYIEGMVKQDIPVESGQVLYPISYSGSSI